MAGNYKIMPHNIEAEQALLGCILIDVQSQGDILGLMKESDFYTDAHKNIYNTMMKIYLKSTPIDFVTLTNQLDKDKLLDKVGGIEYITALTNVVPSAANFKYYCDIVKSDSIRRKLISAGQNIIEDAFENEDKDSSLQFAEKEIFDIAEKEERSALEHVGKPDGAIKKVLEKFDTIAKDPSSLHGIPTGYKEFDQITNGLHNSDLILLAARPGVGKTSFSMNILVNAAVEYGKTCAVFSLEMSKEQLTIFRRRNIGFVFQNYNLVPILNVYENIVLPVELDGDTVDKRFMDEVVKMLGLEDKLQNMPNNLSGGQQQRVAIARALVSKPAIVLADEPTGNLDSKTSADVLGLLQRTSREFNQTLVMITHNNEIAQLADRIVRIEDGKIVE